MLNQFRCCGCEGREGGTPHRRNNGGCLPQYWKRRTVMRQGGLEMDGSSGSLKSHGIYTIPEAARIILAAHPLLGVGGAFQRDFRWRLLHWVDDGVIHNGRFDGGIRRPEKYTTFEALISMRIVFLLWARGVGIGTLSRAEKRLIDELGCPWPLAGKPIWRRETPAFPRFAALIAESKYGPEAMGFLEEWLGKNADGLEFDDSGVAYAWRIAKNVLIHGGVVSGRPCVAGRRTPAWVIHSLFEQGESIEGIAYSYDLTEERIQDAVAWGNQLAAIAF